MLEGTVTVETEQSVTFSFTITNTANQPLSLHFHDACKADFAVYDGEQEHWRWSEGQMFAQILEEVPLEPDEQETFEATWNDPDAGTYTARAELEANDRTCTAETTFSIE